MIIQLPTTAITNSSFQINFLNVMNLFPSSNNLSLSLMTLNNEIIESGFRQIQPVINFDPI
jgi:hypothetical protein